MKSIFSTLSIALLLSSCGVTEFGGFEFVSKDRRFDVNAIPNYSFHGSKVRGEYLVGLFDNITLDTAIEKAMNDAMNKAGSHCIGLTEAKFSFQKQFLSTTFIVEGRPIMAK